MSKVGRFRYVPVRWTNFLEYLGRLLVLVNSGKLENVSDDKPTMDTPRST